METTTVLSGVVTLTQETADQAIARRPFESAAIEITRRSRKLNARLTRRQLDVLGLLCEGMANKHIGRKLGISCATVKVHIGGIFRVLDVSSRLQAVIAARQRGWVAGAAAVGETARPDTAYPPRVPVTLRVV